MRFTTLTAGFILSGFALPAAAAAPQFGLEYRVERADSARLSLATCLATAKRASAELGYVTTMGNSYPGQLAMFASGPKGGGSSLIVYCIAVDRKTAFVVQAMDYNRPASAASARVADHVHRALLKAGGQ